MMNNKVWEIVEKEAHEGSRGYDYRRGRPSYRREEDERYSRKDSPEHAYDEGYDEGYSDAMKKIFHILREGDK